MSDGRVSLLCFLFIAFVFLSSMFVFYDADSVSGVANITQISMNSTIPSQDCLQVLFGAETMGFVQLRDSNDENLPITPECLHIQSELERITKSDFDNRTGLLLMPYQTMYDMSTHHSKQLQIWKALEEWNVISNVDVVVSIVLWVAILIAGCSVKQNETESGFCQFLILMSAIIILGATLGHITVGIISMFDIHGIMYSHINALEGEPLILTRTNRDVSDDFMFTACHQSVTIIGLRQGYVVTQIISVIVFGLFMLTIGKMCMSRNSEAAYEEL